MRELQIAQGQWFTPGRREVVVGQSVAKRYESAKLGGKLRFGRGEWEVVGVFDGGKSAVNSEIWCDLNQLAADFERQGGVSSVLMRLQDASQVEPLIKSISNNTRLNAEPRREQEYYQSMTESGQPIQFLGFFVATIMAIGSAFGAMNTMYAAVGRRGREIGTLRALGFSRISILGSFMFESLMLALIGGLIGCAIALPLNGVTTGIGSFQSFSEVAFNFHVGPASMMKGLIFAAVIGTLGGLLPSWAASRRDLLTSLREG
jgi:putative ABC transport system permease protein